MDRARSKQLLKEDVKVQTSIDSEESDDGDEEWTPSFVVRKRNSIPSKWKKALRLAMKHQRGVDRQLYRGLEFYQFLQSLNWPSLHAVLAYNYFSERQPPSILTEDDLSSISGRYGFPN